ncbi:hypothetical protein [Myxosarcina sp. GI1]|uniref:hypothetical protein n=1 Tax=Myxosarcina sp. GI1 TaxID=1541065 RepID=UPI0012E064BA|nr:hypothetical protein [Myxosarcina sp. GI1]
MGSTIALRKSSLLQETVKFINNKAVFYQKFIIIAVNYEKIVEGYDYQIIKQLDLLINHPLMILTEYKNLTYWETFKLVIKLRKNYKIFATSDNILAVDIGFNRLVS